MLDGPRRRYREALARVHRVERRELRELRRWLEHTSNLVHVSILVFVPLLIGVVTYISNLLNASSFLIFPPLASGTYTLFADPEGKYSSAPKFVGGMTLGALSGWVALELSARYWYNLPPGQFQVHAGAAALGILLTGLVTWALDLEEPTAFSTALLVLLFAGSRTTAIDGVAVSYGIVYVFGVFVSSTLVAMVFVLWRDEFYERRARYLYETTRGDDHVLVPMQGDHAGTVAMFAARIAGAHEAGKVVLLDVVDDADVAAAEREMLDRLVGVDTAAVGAVEGRDAVPEEAADRDAVAAAAERDVAAESVRRLEREASRIETKVGVPCDVVVAADGGDVASVVRQTAEETNCDLVVTPYEEERGGLSPAVRSLFRTDLDVVALRPAEERTEWRRVMVPVRRAGDQAHAMVDFALRLAGRAGNVSVCRCIDDERKRRRAEELLAQLVETFSGRFETRVAREAVTAFIREAAPNYDLVVVGASTDRSTASRFLVRPTFERLRDVDCDVAVVHRGR